MFRETFADLNMYFYLIILSLFYSVNSLAVSNTNDSTTVSPSLENKTSSAPGVTPLLDEKIRVVTITSTEGPTVVTRKETEPDFKKGLLQLLNKPTVIGSICRDITDCKTQNNSVCLNGICQCETEFVASPNNNTCLPKAKALHDACLENIQCDSIYGASGLAICASFQCVCSSNSVLKNDRCYKKRVLGNDCKEDNDCASIQYSYCFQRTCACDPDFFPDITGTQCFPFSGTSNMTDLNCKASSAVCIVFGRHAYCSNDTCVCYPGYHLNNNSCVKIKSLGEHCESYNDCKIDMQPTEKPGARECKNNKCVCVKGYKGIPEHNICQSGSSILSQSLLLILGSLFFLLK